jgi:hypothetical protein
MREQRAEALAHDQHPDHQVGSTDGQPIVLIEGG